ncbi:cysteine desulfurase family protein [Paenibacillus periandrae]|uniref:cysteine desulfurase family protein n=1 Tax=Paenibacillus periandrae TaxID=1761741 RepID=UPI001F08A344|nr:cysteine desulfurase family protein [Paenibacillus periandrae]
MLYLDYAATTPPYDEVIDAVAEVMKQHYGNPSSLHRMGVVAEQLVSQARAVIASSLSCQPVEIRFTSGGTESNNWAIQATARRFRQRGNHLITTAVEHASVYETFRELERQGFRVTYLPVDATGAVKLEELDKALSDDTILVSIMAVNNEIGRIQPISAIGELLRQRSRTIVFHVDAVQAIGKVPLHPGKLKIDLLSCSAHKLRGPKGSGFLYVRKGLELPPLMYGGGQEGGLRSGTENVPSLVGMAKAIRMAVEEQDRFHAHTHLLRKQLAAAIRDIPELRLSGSDAEGEMAPHIVHFCFPGMKSEVLVHALEEADIYVSSRSACSSSANKPSRVLKAMGFDDARAISGIRVSYSLSQTIDDINYFGEQLQKAVARLKHTITGQPNQRR